MSIFFLIHIFFLALFAGLGVSQDECTATMYCKDQGGPAIRFPFRLKGRQPDRCGYPGFDLSCSQKKDTVFELPFSVKVSVKDIDYVSGLMHIDYLEGCFPPQRPNFNYSYAFPFQFDQPSIDFALFNCTSTNRLSNYLNPVTCLSSPGYQVYAVDSDTSIGLAPILFCRRMYNISSVPYQILYHSKHGQRLSWSTPNCSNCEAQGKYCGWKSNNTERQIDCLKDIPINTSTTGAWKKLKIAGAILGPLLLLLVIIGVYHSHNTSKIPDDKIARFLEDYRALKPTRYSYADIKKLTNQFRDRVGQGGYGTVYKGMLSNDIHVAVKVLNNSKGKGEDFINEVATIGGIHHVNVVRLVGYCADGFIRALVYEFLPNNSLEKFVCSGKNHHKKHFLGWAKMEQIALGIAKGIEYLHQGCAQRILHFDIKPHNILLDHNFNPKISDFGQAKLCSKEKSIVSMTAARGTMGYIAPEVFSRNFGNVSSKSDIYSFGMLLLEIVGGRKNNDVEGQNDSEAYFPEWIYDRLDRGGDPGVQIVREGDPNIVKKLTIVGLWCIRWHPIDRPSMKVVIQMLEGEDIPAMPPNPFGPANPQNTSATTRGRPFNNELEVISESE